MQDLFKKWRLHADSYDFPKDKQKEMFKQAVSIAIDNGAIDEAFIDEVLGTMMKKEFADLMLHLSGCLKEVDGIDIEWRVLKKYCDDFLQDEKIKLIRR